MPAVRSCSVTLSYFHFCYEEFFFFLRRHPSNLMLNRLSGKICHIDFGDCFEVRMWYSLCSAECLKIIDGSFSILF